MSAEQFAVISLSGGMDSTSLVLHYLSKKYKVIAISFNYGQKHAIEIERAKSFVQFLKDSDIHIQHEIADLSSAMELFKSALISKDEDIPTGHYEESQMKSTVVPNRNAIFSSIVFGKALSIAQEHNVSVKIGLGVHSGDHAIYPDCRPEFYHALSHAFFIGNWDSERVTFDLPYLHGDKTTILQDAIDSCNVLKLDFDEVFKRTITSYEPDREGRSSGKTGSDVERILAFHSIGRQDPVDYQSSWEEVLQHALQLEAKFLDDKYKSTLTELEYYVTRQSGTERPFTGLLLNEKRSGTFTCKCCDHPLFDSNSKFDSGCGWPSFHSELEQANILRIEDLSHGMIRIEVRCPKCDAHLGHVFNDGPRKFGGERYCINSASMNFESKEDDS
jgi:7-cyano-7-deazaguanine synthase